MLWEVMWVGRLVNLSARLPAVRASHCVTGRPRDSSHLEAFRGDRGGIYEVEFSHARARQTAGCSSTRWTNETPVWTYGGCTFTALQLSYLFRHSALVPTSDAYGGRGRICPVAIRGAGLETRCQFFLCRSKMKQESTAGQGGGDVQRCPRPLPSAHAKAAASKVGRKHPLLISI